MQVRGTLQIEKRSMPCWLVFVIFALPLLWGTLFGLLHLPSLIKYTADLAWVGLVFFMIFQRNNKIPKRLYPLIIWSCVFFVYCLFMYILNYQSIIYFLWGTRNNFRYYVFFFAILLYFRERDAIRSYQILHFCFWVNVPITRGL